MLPQINLLCTQDDNHFCIMLGHGFKALSSKMFDMIFVERQLVEKAREHNSLLFTLFIDLKKAYDSAPRAALWQVLEKCGVPLQLFVLLYFLTCTSVLSLRIGGNSVLWRECPLGTQAHGCKLVEDRSAKSRLLPSCVRESKFVDDAVLYASSRDGLEAVASSFVCVVGFDC